MKKYILLLLCLFLLGGCAQSADNANNENQATDNTNTNNIKELVDANLSDEELKEINKIITYLPDDRTKFNPKLSASDLDNQLLLGIGLVDGTTKKEIEQTINDFFGPNIKVKMEDYICPYADHIMQKYNEKKENFEFVELGHGASGANVHREVLNIKTDGEKYYVSVIKMFSGVIVDVMMDTYPVYKSLQDSYDEKNPVINDLFVSEYCYNYSCDFSKFLKENQSKFNVYTYIFAKDADNLYFEEYKLS